MRTIEAFAPAVLGMAFIIWFLAYGLDRCSTCHQYAAAWPVMSYKGPRCRDCRQPIGQ